MYKAPSLGLGPRASTLLPAFASPPLVPGIWSAKQISIRINKPLAPYLWSRGHCQPRPEALTCPPYYCGHEDEAPAIRTQGLRGNGEAGRTHPRKPSQLSRECLLSAVGMPHLPLSNPAGSARWQGAVLVPHLGGNGVAINKYLPLHSSLISRLRGGGGVSSVG